MTSAELPKIAIAEHLAQRICALDVARLPDAVRAKCEDLLVDVIGLAVTARNEDYVKAALAGCDDDGPCTAIGHNRTLSSAGAALVNGTAIHGEDFDDTFEGGPIHAGAVIVPAVLAACERHNLDGRAALLGIAIGVETMCRLSTVAPTLTHKAGFHPTAVFGAMGAAAGVGAALKLNPRQLVDALGTAASMASGIIEYLAEGAWTKRLHAGWAAQSGIRAALLGRAGFSGPRTVFEGVHGFFHGFAHTIKGDYDALIGDFGTRWVTRDAGVQALPMRDHDASLYRLRAPARGAKNQGGRYRRDGVRGRRGHRASAVGAARRQAKARQRLCRKILNAILRRHGFVRGNVGLSDFSDAAVRDPAVVALAAKVRYRIDPQNPYPKNFTGHIRATLRDGSVVEERQPYMRGGAQEPLTRADIQDKFLLNAAHGGWTAARAAQALKLIGTLFDGPVELTALRD